MVPQFYVTTILDKTKSEEKKQALRNWKKRVGEEKAQQIVTEAPGRGTRMHKWLEDYVEIVVMGESGSNPIAHKVILASLILEHGLKNANEYWGTEVTLYYSGLYAGTTDLVGLHNDTPIMDFKQTNKPKKDRMDRRLFFTIMCPCLRAHNNMYDTKINKGVILMCSKDYQYQEWILEGTAFEYYSNIRFHRVAEYYG